LKDMKQKVPSEDVGMCIDGQWARAHHATRLQVANTKGQHSSPRFEDRTAKLPRQE
jgi:hypothetical protein